MAPALAAFDGSGDDSFAASAYGHLLMDDLNDLFVPASSPLDS
jgi:hypothetical protein